MPELIMKSLKKLIQPLRDNLELRGFKEPLLFQEKILTRIKGGANMFAFAPNGSGKTTSIVLSAIQKLQGKALDDVPRVVIIVKDKQSALEMESEFNAFKNGTDLRVCIAYEEQNIEVQKEQIYSGVDVVIATPKRLSKIYFLNGISFSKVQMFAIDDAEALFKDNKLALVTRLQASMGNCQYLVFAETFDDRFEVWQDTFMFNAQIVI